MTQTERAEGRRGKTGSILVGFSWWWIGFTVYGLQFTVEFESPRRRFVVDGSLSFEMVWAGLERLAGDDACQAPISRLFRHRWHHIS